MTGSRDGSVKSLRVLHVLDELRPSGAEVMLELAAPWWAEQGVEAQLLSLSTVRGAFADRLAAAGYPIHQLPPAPRLGMLQGFHELVVDQAIDVVHIHEERANFWLGSIAWARGIGVVYTSHNCFFFARALRVERVAQRALGRAMGFRYVSVGTSVAANESARFFNPTTIISNWYDLDRFKPPTEQERLEARTRLNVGEEFVVVSVGNCAEFKNHELILRALAGCGALNYLYMHAGDHSGAVGTEEMRLSARLSLDRRVRFLGPVEDVAGLLYAADLFVMSSQREGLGIAAAEALSCGLPLVLTDVPGLRDLGAYGGDVQFIGPDPAGMASAIRAVAARTSVPQAATRPDRPNDALRCDFAPSSGVANYARMYRESMSGSRARSRVSRRH